MPSRVIERVTRPSEVRFGVRDFEAMDAAGLLPERPELVDGRIIAMPAVGNAHDVSRGDFHEEIAPHWRRPKFIRSQATHRFAGGWAPMPDLALLDERPTPGAEIDPLPRLVIEIADSTLAYDLGEKRLRYALAGVPEYVVAELPHRRLRVLRGPVAGAGSAAEAWRDEAILSPGDRYAPLCLPGLDLDVATVLPEAGFAP